MTVPELTQSLKQYAQSENFPELLTTLLASYYSNADSADLNPIPIEELAKSAQAHIRLAQKMRPQGSVLSAIYLPSQSDAPSKSHTLIHIVSDDMPFLIDSLIMLLNQEQITLDTLIHPIFSIQRNTQNEATDIQPAKQHIEHHHRESFLCLRLAHCSLERAEQLVQQIRKMLDELRLVVSSEEALRAQLKSIIQTIQAEGRETDSELIAFLQWLEDNHFLFMGFCDYTLETDNQSKAQLKASRSDALGILSGDRNQPYSIGFAALSEEDKRKWLEGERLILNKSQRRSHIHRNANLDLIGIQKLDSAGKVVGQWRFIGLYTAQAYLESVWDVPILRHKANQALLAGQFVSGSHKEKTTRFVLQTYPRDELFEIHPEDLARITAGIVALNERPRTRLFTRIDDFKRYVSALVYLPKETFDTALRERVGNYLAQAFAASATEFHVQLTGDSPLTRVHFLFATHADTLPEFSQEALEADIHRMVAGWESQWQAAAQGILEPDTIAQYQRAFGAGYREAFSPKEAIDDIAAISAAKEHSLLARFGSNPNESATPYWLKLYSEQKSPSLTKTLPMVENTGFTVESESPYRIHGQAHTVGLSHFQLNPIEGLPESHLTNPDQQNELCQLLEQVWDGKVENDRFNTLIMAAGINWQMSVLMRAIAKYLKQATLPYSQNYIEQTLIRHGNITQTLAKLFRARLHPHNANSEEAEKLNHNISDMLSTVPSLDDDRILNAYRSVILATRRTNFWQSIGLPETISLKLESHAIDFLPEPRPLYEIWVYSPRMEGIHLRGSKVARGGLRWSDRYEDFRTEVLGLVKAQMVKNAVIIPSGAKGGFVCKHLPTEPAKRQAEGITCYRMFINSLLDITDNRQNNTIIAPANTKRLDQDDPYLVVAADKGTASFSDIANEIAQAHGFWLDDAFASGGSAGYDHKGMGITARGAWESVKRHFRHLGKNIQEEEFTVIGIGDMAGDVFGNGMLLSKHILLKAAFNHKHIFLDPNPNAAQSYAERQRLFAAAQGWDGYQTHLISQGGGVYERSAKTIDLSPEVQEWLGLPEKSLTPDALIHALLKADVELLYNGGIGTYIKAEEESHADVRDKANDAIRVNGKEVKARVLGEGGNLGATQLGRIEYWQHGGRCNTDAIDNSAGVDCSDHEVNIKILLGEEVRAGRLSLSQRDQLLKEMTDDVAALVLRNNYLQTQILAMNQLDPAAYLGAHRELIHYLSQHTALNPALEFLPNGVELQARAAEGKGLSNPEVAVLLSYAKIHCQNALLESNLPDNPYFLPVLQQYFPQALQTRYQSAMQNHYLKREIIANQLANRVINRMGISFVQRFSQESEASIAEVVSAYVIADALINGEAQFATLEALDNHIPANTQMRLIADIARLLNRIARQLLTHYRPFSDITAIIRHYQQDVADFIAKLPEHISSQEHPHIAKREDELRQYSALNEPIITFLARLPYIENVLTILDLEAATKKPSDHVAKAYFMLSEKLDMSWLYHAIAALPRNNHWQNQATLAIREDAQRIHLNLTRELLQAKPQAAHDIAEARKHIQNMQQYGQPDLAMLSALIRDLSKLASTH